MSTEIGPRAVEANLAQALCWGAPATILPDVDAQSAAQRDLCTFRHHDGDGTCTNR